MKRDFVDDCLSIYLNELDKYDITREEEIEYFKKIQKGDLEVRDEFIEKNLRLVLTVANGYKNYGVDMIDLIQEGNIGLMRAVKEFDYSLGFRFSGYAIPWIKKYIREAVAEQSRVIAIPKYLNDLRFKIKRMTETYETKYGYTPTDKEIGDLLGVKEEKITEIKNEYQVISLDSTFNNEDSSDDDLHGNKQLKNIEMIKSEESTPEDILVDNDKKESINRFIENNLKNNELIVIKKRIMFHENKPQTLISIGEELGITQERVRQIQNKATNRLRTSKDIYSLMDYIPEENIQEIKNNVKHHKKIKKRK